MDALKSLHFSIVNFGINASQFPRNNHRVQAVWSNIEWKSLSLCIYKKLSLEGIICYTCKNIDTKPQTKMENTHQRRKDSLCISSEENLDTGFNVQAFILDRASLHVLFFAPTPNLPVSGWLGGCTIPKINMKDWLRVLQNFCNTHNASIRFK